jgi:hypothetical protein
MRGQALGAMLGHVAAEPLRKVTQMLVRLVSLLRPGVEARRRTDSRLLILTGI